VIGTNGGGSVLRVEDSDLDSREFERLAAEGAAALATGRFPRAKTILDAALSLWQGNAFEDFQYARFAQGEVARLEELRLGSLENRIAAELGMGLHREVVAELRELTADDPLREDLWGHLMVALYRTGQQADALRAYQTARGVLGDEKVSLECLGA
jgi:DNA-binding SARP family transcriptional activator